MPKMSFMTGGFSMRDLRASASASEKEPCPHTGFKGLKALDGMVHIDVGQDGRMDDDLYALLTDDDA